jgi:hypothetical protein
MEARHKEEDGKVGRLLRGDAGSATSKPEARENIGRALFGALSHGKWRGEAVPERKTRHEDPE